MTEQQIKNLGYTMPVYASCLMADLELLIKPDTDLDSRFKAWDADNGEWLMINGWNFIFETEELWTMNKHTDLYILIAVFAALPVVSFLVGYLSWAPVTNSILSTNG